MNNTYVMLSTTKYIKDEECFDTLKDIIKPNMSIVCLPYACDINYQFKECRKDLTYNGSFWNEHYNYFKEYGISKSNFYIATPSDNIEFIKWKIDKADIIYFSGGSMKNLKFMLQTLGLWDMIKKIDNKVIILESASVLVFQETYTVFREGIPFEHKGLNMFDTVDIFVHYNKNIHEDLFREFKRFADCKIKQKYIYALSDDGALILNNNNKIIKIGNVYE